MALSFKPQQARQGLGIRDFNLPSLHPHARDKRAVPDNEAKRKENGDAAALDLLPKAVLKPAFITSVEQIEREGTVLCPFCEHAVYTVLWLEYKLRTSLGSRKPSYPQSCAFHLHHMRNEQLFPPLRCGSS